MPHTHHRLLLLIALAGSLFGVTPTLFAQIDAPTLTVTYVETRTGFTIELNIDNSHVPEGAEWIHSLHIAFVPPGPKFATPNKDTEVPGWTHEAGHDKYGLNIGNTAIDLIRKEGQNIRPGQSSSILLRYDKGTPVNFTTPSVCSFQFDAGDRPGKWWDFKEVKYATLSLGGDWVQPSQPFGLPIAVPEPGTFGGLAGLSLLVVVVARRIDARPTRKGEGAVRS